MKPGDIIYKVGDTLVAGESLDVLVSNYIKGKEGTDVQITVYRAESDTYEDMTITRRKIEVPTVESKMLADNLTLLQWSSLKKPLMNWKTRE